MGGQEAYLAEKIPVYVQKVRGAATLEERMSHFLDLTRSILDAELEDFEVDRHVSTGRIYALLRNLAFEFTGNLHWHGWEGESRLKAYIADLKSRRPQATYTAVITDGLHFHVCRTEYDERDKDVALASIHGLNLVSPMMTPERALEDLRTLLSYLHQEQV